MHKSLFLKLSAYCTFVYIPVSEHFSFVKIIHPTDKKLHKHDHYTGAPCAGDNKRPLKCAVLSHNTMPQMSEVLKGACNWYADCSNVQLLPENLMFISLP